MATSFLFVVCFASIVYVSYSREESFVPYSTAKNQMEKLIDIIETKTKEMESLYGYKYPSSPAKKTIETVFREEGVKDKALIYVDSRADWVSTTWADLSEFYLYHQKTLEDSLLIVKKQGHARKSDLEYLEKVMDAWTNQEKEAGRQFKELVKLMGTQASIAEQKINVQNRQHELSQKYFKNYQSTGKYDDRALEAELKPLREEETSLQTEYDRMDKEITIRRQGLSSIGKNVRLFSVINPNISLTNSGTKPGARSGDGP